MAGLVASSLAYGRVKLILGSVGSVLGLLGPNPSCFVQEMAPARLMKELSGFRHRFTPGEDVAGLLLSIASVQKEWGLAGNLMAHLIGTGTYLDALDAFVVRLLKPMGNSYLLPRPSRGSACKRLHLFMRWMVRRDDVDPGGWDMISPSMLMVPVDTHMFTMGKCLGFTARRTADGRAAAEITDGFRSISPGDPVKYDFSLTRFGIRDIRDCSLFARLMGGH
jgi:uncharacterized protein (TIGR02757 family)